jgi:hypothetical protein
VKSYTWTVRADDPTRTRVYRVTGSRLTVEAEGAVVHEVSYARPCEARQGALDTAVDYQRALEDDVPVGGMA